MPVPPPHLDPDAATRWRRARARAVDHLLAAVAGSRRVDELVLRGSVLLKAWYGAAARDPGDLDFVVTTKGWGPEDGRTDRMFAEIVRRAEESSATDAFCVRVVATRALDETLRAYDRAPGRRLGLPWRAEGLPGGTVHLDFVFGERLPSEPELVEVPRSDGTGTHLLVGATPEQSLAWKLLWLVEDDHPRPQDLHDAVLLAEHVPLPVSLLRATFMAFDPGHGGRPFTVASLALDRVKPFEPGHDHPELMADELPARLIRALAPTFAADAGSGESGYARAVRRLRPWIEKCRALRGDSRALSDVITADSWHLDSALVVYREVMGPGTCDLAEAARVVTGHWDARPAQVGHERWHPYVVAEAFGRLG
ncbi:nucleotidyl transferase AbiEii/AbiGii toxin family protein [Embleya sp. MST-111070]|uniref:nucleotidyl transferase AbiEii/AbiGii toxin family protein n=1 Tax=Embleya sp. MST-111070 TaxID=3398231 RepID=UPI003F7335D6